MGLLLAAPPEISWKKSTDLRNQNHTALWSLLPTGHSRPQLKAAGCTRHKAGPKAPSRLSRTGLCRPQLSTEGQEAGPRAPPGWLFPLRTLRGRGTQHWQAGGPQVCGLHVAPSLQRKASRASLQGGSSPWVCSHAWNHLQIAEAATWPC